MRTRMSGGVGGGLSDEAPYPDSHFVVWQRIEGIPELLLSP